MFAFRSSRRFFLRLALQILRTQRKSPVCRHYLRNTLRGEQALSEGYDFRGLHDLESTLLHQSVGLLSYLLQSLKALLNRYVSKVRGCTYSLRCLLIRLFSLFRLADSGSESIKKAGEAL